MAVAHSILGKFLGVVCLCFPPPLDVPTFAARCLYVCNDARDPSSERWNCGWESCPGILPKFRLPSKFRDLLHVANLRHGTDGFTSPPKEGVLGIFFALKFRRLRRGLNPRTWVLKASTLPLDHRSRYWLHTLMKLISFSRNWACIFCEHRDNSTNNVCLLCYDLCVIIWWWVAVSKSECQQVWCLTPLAWCISRDRPAVNQTELA